MDIVVIKLGAIGDVIRTTSILPGLKSKYRNCRVDWITKKECFDVLKNNNLINTVYIIDNNTIKNLKNKYDLVICLDDDYEACELAAKINSKKIIGAYLRNGKRDYTNDSSLWFGMGLISRFGRQKADRLKAKNKKTYQEIMYRILDLRYKKQEPILILDKKSMQFAKNFIKKNNIKKSSIVIGINTGAGGRWEDKKLSIEDTAQLINKLNKIKNYRLVLFGGPEEKERNRKIKESAKIIDAGCDNSIMEFASLVNLCNVLITSDSLALHIGTALKKRIVCFFYPTSANEIELYGRGIKIIGKGRSYCSYQAKCKYPPEWDVDGIVKSVKKLSKK